MATKKKTQKRTKHISHNKTHILLRKSLAMYAAIIFVAFILVSLSAFTIVETYRASVNYDRESRIYAIYNDLNLDSSYKNVSTDIFGDKRVYEWDESRSYSSSVVLARNADRSATFADLKAKIEAEGFTQIEGPDYGDLARQDHYMSEDGEYIRVSIETKATYDSYLFDAATPAAGSNAALEDGPVYITIKVNLDDNNE